MIVRVKYQGRIDEDHELKNGVHFADLSGTKDVPGSKQAFKLRGHSSLPDRHPQEEGNHRQHRAGQRERPLRPDRPGCDGRRLRVITQTSSACPTLRLTAWATPAVRRQTLEDYRTLTQCKVRLRRGETTPPTASRSRHSGDPSMNSLFLPACSPCSRPPPPRPRTRNPPMAFPPPATFEGAVSPDPRRPPRDLPHQSAGSSEGYLRVL